MKYYFVFLLVCISAHNTYALKRDAPSPAKYADNNASRLSFEGYGEIYYGYDFNTPTNNSLPHFVQSHDRHNEVNINMVLLSAAYNADRVRGKLGIMAGTYPNSAMATEPGVLKNIYEGNAGVRLARKRDLWLDAGIFTSHIGIEGPVSMDCASLTRSLVADGSPYYESGVRLSYESLNQKWYMALLHLNGWQRIERQNGNSTPAGGMQIMYKPNEKTTLNMSTFVGNDEPDSTRKMRHFVDLYAVVDLSEKWQVTAVLDGGRQQSAKNSSSYQIWMGSALILKFSPVKKYALVARGEYFNDAHNIVMQVSTTGLTSSGFYVWGYSLGFDCHITDNVLWRAEAKGYTATKPTFVRDNALFNDSYLLTTSLAVRLKK